MTEDTPDLYEVSAHEFVVEHTIRSTPARVFEAYTDPDQITEWWASPGHTMRVDEMDVQPGGTWRFTHLLDDGDEMVMHGEYREIEPVTRLSYTYSMGDGTDEEILTIIEIEAVEDGAHVTLTNRCASQEHLDDVLSWGAEAGAKAALRSLADLLEDD